MISTVPIAHLSYDSVKYITLQEKTAAIRAKNEASSQDHEHYLEKVWYPDNSNFLCWINQDIDNCNTHWHPAIEIIMPIQNYFYMELEGEECILQEGDILVIPPGFLHSLTNTAYGYRMISLFDYTALSHLPGFSAISSILSAPSLIRTDKNSVIYKTCRDILLSLINIYTDDFPFWEISSSAMFLQFLVQLNQYQMQSSDLFLHLDSGKQKEYMKKFSMVFDYINKHYMEDLNLETAAATAGFSKYYFCRLFKQFTNMNFHDYVNSFRIQVAVTMLSNCARST